LKCTERPCVGPFLFYLVTDRAYAEQDRRRPAARTRALLPAISTAAPDGRFLNASGIPTYDVPGRFSDPDCNGVHGLNERKSVQGLCEERNYLFELIQARQRTWRRRNEASTPKSIDWSVQFY
jgi:hypothetical protein